MERSHHPLPALLFICCADFRTFLQSVRCDLHGGGDRQRRSVFQCEGLLRSIHTLDRALDLFCFGLHRLGRRLIHRGGLLRGGWCHLSPCRRRCQDGKGHGSRQSSVHVLHV